METVFNGFVVGREQGIGFCEQGVCSLCLIGVSGVELSEAALR